jgi:hypothetical protein
MKKSLSILTGTFLLSFVFIVININAQDTQLYDFDDSNGDMPCGSIFQMAHTSME